jgi:hypothetical protein
VTSPAYGGRKSTSVQPTASIHTLSVSGADNPSSRYQPLRFCISAIPTCRYLPLLDIAIHALHSGSYQKSTHSGVKAFGAWTLIGAKSLLLRLNRMSAVGSPFWDHCAWTATP